SYLSRFRSTQARDKKYARYHGVKDNVGVNLGNLYLPIRAVDQKPVFTQGPTKGKLVDETSGPLHTSLVKIRDVQTINDCTLRGIGLTLVQLNRLGLSSVVIVDCCDGKIRQESSLRQLVAEQADRVVAAIDFHGGLGARRVDNVLGISGVNHGLQSSATISSGIHVTNRDLILTPLRRGKLPVIAPIAFSSVDQTLTCSSSDAAMQALAQDLAGIRPRSATDFDSQDLAKEIESAQKEISLDRIILLDPLGGIPSSDRHSHVFINLEQEYDAVHSELLGPRIDPDGQPTVAGRGLDFGSSSNPSPMLLNESSPVEDESPTVIAARRESGAPTQHLGHLTTLVFWSADNTRECSQRQPTSARFNSWGGYETSAKSPYPQPSYGQACVFIIATVGSYATGILTGQSTNIRQAWNAGQYHT
ncbi:MAG: hypothetical protein Q9183_005890, partial [Haloplaca sp. 2 TL-2023]